MQNSRSIKYVKKLGQKSDYREKDTFFRIMELHRHAYFAQCKNWDENYLYSTKRYKRRIRENFFKKTTIKRIRAQKLNDKGRNYIFNYYTAHIIITNLYNALN